MMKALQQFSRYLTLVNVLLAVGILFVGTNIAGLLMRTDYHFKLPRVTYEQPPPERTSPEADTPSLTDYAIIGEKNLFNPERVICMDRKQDLPRPELILYGTIIDGAEQVAFVEDKKNPITTLGRGKRQIVLKKGSTISGFTVTEITGNGIVLTKGGDKIVVPLTDGEKRKDEKAPASRVPQVVSNPLSIKRTPHPQTTAPPPGAKK